MEKKRPVFVGHTSMDKNPIKQHLDMEKGDELYLLSRQPRATVT